MSLQISIIKVVDEFYRDIYSIVGINGNNGRGGSPREFDIPPIPTKEVKKSLGATQKDKAAGEDEISAGALKSSGQIVLEKLVTTLTQCLMTSSTTESWKNANIISIH